MHARLLGNIIVLKVFQRQICNITLKVGLIVRLHIYNFCGVLKYQIYIYVILMIEYVCTVIHYKCQEQRWELLNEHRHSPFIETNILFRSDEIRLYNVSFKTSDQIYSYEYNLYMYLFCNFYFSMIKKMPSNVFGFISLQKF